MKSQTRISLMALLAAFLASSASAYSLLGPFVTNAPPPTSEETYLAGYQDGYRMGYHGAWVGPRVFTSGRFAEAYWRGEQRGRCDGISDAEAEWRERARIDAERARERKRPWHPPLLPDDDESREEGIGLVPDFLQFRLIE